MKLNNFYVCFLSVAMLSIAASATGVSVSSPTNGATVSSPVHFVATATTSCSKGVSAMGIYTAPFVLAYRVSGAKIDTNLSLSAGTYNTVVQEWDNCGGSSTTTVSITVVGGQTGVFVTSPANKMMLRTCPRQGGSKSSRSTLKAGSRGATQKPTLASGVSFYSPKKISQHPGRVLVGSDFAGHRASRYCGSHSGFFGAGGMPSMSAG